MMNLLFTDDPREVDCDFFQLLELVIAQKIRVRMWRSPNYVDNTRSYDDA